MRGLMRADSVAALGFLATGAFYLWQATKYPYTAESGVGAGFLPFWIGLALILGALLLLYRATASRIESAGEATPGRGQALLLIGCMVAFLVAMDRLGMLISVFAFTALSTWLLGLRWWGAIAAATGLAALIHVLFQRWLGVPLPIGPLGV